MKYDVFRRLKELSDARGMEYGKLVQKLLAIAFCEAGVTRVTERSTQGVDLEVTLQGDRRFALEVKTAQEGTLTLAKKDIDGLAAREEEGYATYLALLGSRLLDNWIFARCLPSEIRARRRYSLTELRAYRDIGLQDLVGVYFASAVSNHTKSAIEDGQGALDTVLREFPSYALA